VPAHRSRTAGWHRCLEQLQSRQGPIELAVARVGDDAEGATDLMWRARLLELSPDGLIVEHPSTMGELVPLEPTVELQGAFAVGQNRWHFRTTLRTLTEHGVGGRRTVRALVLDLPEGVTRCTRREFNRVRTTGHGLPEVDLWPLLDPASVVVAERAAALGQPASEDVRPEVGPRFSATLENIGGGGLGLRVGPEHGRTLARHKVFWIRFSLPPELDTPIEVTAKVAHTHLDSSQTLYVGVAFDFTFNPAHQDHVVGQICRYVADRQQRQRGLAA